MIFCGTTLLAAEATTSWGCQHIHCPITLAMRQKILRTNPFPLPSTAHLPTRFSLRSQLCGTLCGCAADFTSVSTVSYLRYAYYTRFVSICQALFFAAGGQIFFQIFISEDYPGKWKKCAYRVCSAMWCFTKCNRRERPMCRSEGTLSHPARIIVGGWLMGASERHTGRSLRSSTKVVR